MEKEIEEEERSANEAGKDGNDVDVEVDDLLWFKYMEAKLASKSKQCQLSHPFTICRVPRDIRRVDNDAHDPLIVSIGPYHRGNPNLHDMEEVKWRNLNEFRGRAGKDFNKYLKAMKEIEPRARACYSGKIDLDADEFIETMLLDGLFIIELFSTRGSSFLFLIQRLRNINKKEPIYTIRGTLRRVGHDMLLLENQLPFFVLERLWNLTNQRSRLDLWESACTFLLDFSLPFEHEWDLNLLPVIFDEEEEKEKEDSEMINEDGVHHLLHLVYLLLKPTSLTRKSESMEPTAKLPAFIKKILPFLSPSISISKHEQPSPVTVIPSAVELDEAGVEFQCVKAKSFLDVKFEQGTMKMPRLSVQDPTKSLLRNFIAYEQCFPHQGSHFTSYCIFMDDLVNTRIDVEILKKSLIIENGLGSDKEVALLFNDLGKGIFALGFEYSYLADTFVQVTKHTQKTWPKWRAKLKHDYFSNPWAIISLIAATFVIFLTTVQTYYAAFT